LYLMRHAHAAPGGTLGDLYRPLDQLGRDQARRIGAALADAGVEWVLTSPAARTRQTVAGLGLGAPVEVVPALYGGGCSVLIDRLRQLDDDLQRVLLVGHNPDVAAAVQRLYDPADSDPTAVGLIQTHFPTATCCQLEFDQPWSELSSARLRRSLRSKPPRSPADDRR
jgi:phosphohistidine phosphatase